MTYAEVSINLHVRMYVFQLKHNYWSCTSLLVLVQFCCTEKSRGRFVLAVPGTGICWISANSVTPLGWFHCHHMCSFFFHCRASASVVDKDIVCATSVMRSGTTWPVPVLSVNQYTNPHSLPSTVVCAWPTHFFFCNSQGICFTDDLSRDMEWEWSH